MNRKQRAELSRSGTLVQGMSLGKRGGSTAKLEGPSCTKSKPSFNYYILTPKALNFFMKTLKAKVFFFDLKSS